jgi:hypothetical protein
MVKNSHFLYVICFLLELNDFPETIEKIFVGASGRVTRAYKAISRGGTRHRPPLKIVFYIYSGNSFKLENVVNIIKNAEIFTIRVFSTRGTGCCCTLMVKISCFLYVVCYFLELNHFSEIIEKIFVGAGGGVTPLQSDF